jgi:flagellar basal body-associated protein FliL
MNNSGDGAAVWIMFVILVILACIGTGTMVAWFVSIP